jgi:hypothetical protein
MFDVTFEAGWRSAPPEPLGWLQQYAVRRYGGQSALMEQATTLLYASALQNFGIE